MKLLLSWPPGQISWGDDSRVAPAALLQTETRWEWVLSPEFRDLPVNPTLLGGVWL